MKRFACFVLLLAGFAVTGCKAKDCSTQEPNQAYSGTTIVIALSPDEANEAKAISDEQKTLDARKQSLEKSITAKYATTTCPRRGGCALAGFTNIIQEIPYRGSMPKPGWEGGFSFSQDFKYIVPNPSSLAVFER